MHNKALALMLLPLSVAAVAATTEPAKPLRIAARATLASAVEATTAPQATPVYRPPAPAAQAYPPSSMVASSISRWHTLRQTDGLPFSSYATFLLSHRGWPGETAMRQSAERAIGRGASSAEVVSYFRVLPPLTATGHAQHAFALLAVGQVEEARAAARRAWHMGVLQPTDESRILGQFGTSLTPQDHDRRLEALLDNGDTASAMRTLPLASAAQRPLLAARLALQTRAPNAHDLYLAVAAQGAGHAGLVMDRAEWLRNTGQSIAARSFLAQPRTITVRPQNAASYLETLLTIARAAANDSQWTMAYQIASQGQNAYAPGTDVSERPFKERDHYTSLAWLAASTALNRLGRAADAVRHFESYARAARSSQTKSKGYYWAGRAAASAGQATQASSYLQRAAESPDQFYGQLALERLGRSVRPPSGNPPVPPSEADRTAFQNRNLVEAVRYLGMTGRRSDQTLFIRALAENLDSDQHRVLAGELGRQIGRLDLGVWVAREARNKGANFYHRSGFPEVSVPSAHGRQYTLAQGITRQESSFDRTAVSSAGARGLMQLMPGTARETAAKLGVAYDFNRLTEDPAYNVMLGSTYFARLLDQWGGNVPLAVASYNAGAGNVRRWVRENGDPRMPGVDMLRWIEDIPFQETRNYVQRVIENAVVYGTMRPDSAQTARVSSYVGRTGG